MSPSNYQPFELVELSNCEVNALPARWERKLMTPSKTHQKSVCSASKTSPSLACKKENKSVIIPAPAKRLKLATCKENVSGSDRFIPTRANMNTENAMYRTNSNRIDESLSPRSQAYQRSKQAAMGVDGDSRVLAFQKKAPESKLVEENPLAVLYCQQKLASKLTNSSFTQNTTRQIPGASSRILDAPGLLDDFYINPLDWSVDNQIAIGLGPTVYLWGAASGKIHELTTMEGGELDHVSSVKFTQDDGATLAIGGSDSVVALWDVETNTRLRAMKGHRSRVSCLAWNGFILTSGGRDSTVYHHDVRVQNHIVATLQEGHVSEVCSLKWNADGTTLASGGNDNAICLWDVRADTARLRLTQHQAAVKALAWCPYQSNVLASGGGTSDRTIKIWNAVNGHMESSTDTGSQVCSLQFNPHTPELLSTHGFANCDLTLWKYKSMTKIKDFSGHTSRVLHTAVSPDGSTVCSAAGDESLRFWEIFGAPPTTTLNKKKEIASPVASGLRMRIR